jgi:hypothetical protein
LKDVRKAGLILDMPANVENKHKNEDVSSDSTLVLSPD